jgi:2-succinyl-5-enolpyruvyl-6-hydroxy-3-cyclohexene-1-carboxylate synthase
MLHPAVFNTSALCYHLGVHHAVMSPGSRNAPLTISFARNEQIKKWIIPDERSAGFVALGIAQQLQQPVVLCCTSGTALLNYGPAIAEAYYREIPLIILSADRPSHLIDQRDGQTIRQFEALKNHVKATFQLPLLNASCEEILHYQPIKDGITEALKLPRGPVHINIPFEEPFYPDAQQQLEFANGEAFGSIDLPAAKEDGFQALNISAFTKILVLVGQQPTDDELSRELDKWNDRVVILKSPLNNLNCNGVQHYDLFIKEKEDLQPDLLITTGLSVLSKKLKQFIRKFPPSVHWHFDPSGVEVDTYDTHPLLIKSSLLTFLKTQNAKNIKSSSDFLSKWLEADRLSIEKLCAFDDTVVFSEAKAMRVLLSTIPEGTNLHLGNSMPVRYADMFGVQAQVTTWCNRGTSGIDGISSTAVGSAMVSDSMNVLITGDVSFFYDRNAFFHNYALPNLRIIIINNQGGGIFRLIEGPSKLPELKAYFETRHQRTAEWVCKENNFEYFPIKSLDELHIQLSTFYKPAKGVRVLEIFVDPQVNETEYKKLRSEF